MESDQHSQHCLDMNFSARYNELVMMSDII